MSRSFVPCSSLSYSTNCLSSLHHRISRFRTTPTGTTSTHDTQVNFSVILSLFLFLSLSIFDDIDDCYCTLSSTMRRAHMRARLTVDGYGVSIWCQPVYPRLRREKKRNVFQELGKRKHFFRRTTYYIYAFTVVPFISLSFSVSLPLARFMQNTRPRRASYSVLFLKMISGICCYLVTTFRYCTYNLQCMSSILPLPYIHTHIRVHTYTLSLSLSLPLYLLIYLSVVHSSASTLTLYGLRYVHLFWRARGERERDAARLKK